MYDQIGRNHPSGLRKLLQNSGILPLPQFFLKELSQEVAQGFFQVTLPTGNFFYLRRQGTHFLNQKGLIQQVSSKDKGYADGKINQA